MDLTHSAADEDFREEVRQWLADHLVGEFAALKGRGGSGREHEAYEERVAWNQHLAASGWVGSVAAEVGTRKWRKMPGEMERVLAETLEFARQHLTRPTPEPQDGATARP